MGNIGNKLGFKPLAFHSLIYCNRQTLVNIIKAVSKILKIAVHIFCVYLVIKVACGYFFTALLNPFKKNRQRYYNRHICHGE